MKSFRHLWSIFAILSCLMLLPNARAEHEGKLQILLLGDSTTEGSIPRIVRPEGPHLEQMMELLLAAKGVEKPCHVINVSLSGEYIQRLLDSGRYDKLVKDLPGIDWVFIRYGGNDKSKREDFTTNFPLDYKKLIGQLRRDHPGATIVPMTSISTAGKEKRDDINALVRAVAADENLEVLDVEPRFFAELEKGFEMLHYRRYPLEKVPAEFHKLVEPYLVKESVVVMDNELDPILGHLPGWFGDRHPNLAGYNLIADETANFLVKKLQGSAPKK